VRADLPVEKVVDLLVDNYIGCLPVVDEGACPIGMITKRDLVEPFASRARSVRPPPGDDPATAAMIMLPIVLSLDEHATVLQAAAMMARQDMHHVPVISPKGRLVGIVSALDIVRWLARNDGIAVENASPRAPA
jgi:CBS domain-containing protein